MRGLLIRNRYNICRRVVLVIRIKRRYSNSLLIYDIIYKLSD
jgi:hypothetical protein